MGKEGTDDLVGIFYFNQIFGHLHKSATVDSTSLTTLSCGFPVKVFRLMLKIVWAGSWLLLVNLRDI